VLRRHPGDEGEERMEVSAPGSDHGRRFVFFPTRYRRLMRRRNSSGDLAARHGMWKAPERDRDQLLEYGVGTPDCRRRNPAELTYEVAQVTLRSPPVP